MSKPRTSTAVNFNGVTVLVYVTIFITGSLLHHRFLNMGNIGHQFDKISHLIRGLRVLSSVYALHKGFIVDIYIQILYACMY